MGALARGGRLMDVLQRWIFNDDGKEGKPVQIFKR